ncbi:MAG: exo-alpha-sialidase [Ktedonobacterales bacterium]|nr:exo-alpha-sialidase [Ktedonobacterales bacterium]
MGRGAFDGPGEDPAAVEQRARRLAALSSLAREQLGGSAAAPLSPLPSAPRRPRRRRLALTIGALLVGLALVAGTLAYLAPTLPSFGGAARATPTPPSSLTGTDYTLAGGGPCVTLGRSPQPPYTNVQVSQDGFLAHSEPMVAENPLNPLNLVGGSKFFTDPARYRFQIGYYYTFDGGCTWTDGGLLPGFASKGNVSDISFAFGPNNRVYALVLFVGRDGVESGLAVSASTNGGRTFAAPVFINDDPTGNVFSDKPWIAVDTTSGPHRGSVYVLWSYDHSAACGAGTFCLQELGFSRSTDGGKTFSPTRLVEGSAPFCVNTVPSRPAGLTRCDGVLGAIPTIEPDGTLAVAYAYTDVLAGAPNHTTIPTRMVVVTSRDGGTTWAAPALVATVHDLPPLLRPDRFRTFSLPAFAADPSRTGTLYLAWADEQGSQADILVATSRDGGATWSAPVRANDDPPGGGANHAQPQLAVAPDGVVSVTFFDTRNDPQHALLDVYLAQSTDGGATFRPNVRVTPERLDPALGAPVDPSGLQFFGDYQGLAADDRFVHPFWNDTRTGSQQIETAAIPSAQP